jgi:hypothetical protein
MEQHTSLFDALLLLGVLVAGVLIGLILHQEIKEQLVWLTRLR